MNNDLISRQQAIDELWSINTPDDRIFVDAIVDMLENLQSIDIPFQGKWILYPDYGYWVCSECGFVSKAFTTNILYHFCPHCGANMRGE